MQVLIAKIVESYNPAYGQPDKAAPSDVKGKSRPLEFFFTALMGPLLSHRWLIGIFLGAGLIQLALVATGIGGWQCPVKSTLGITCPGCGLTTAMTLLAKGQWAAAIRMHAFAPLFFMVVALMVVAISLPPATLKKFSNAVTVLERKTGITAIMILGMLLYWLLRFLIL